MKRTPFYEEHASLKARIIDFEGWAMPVQYSGIVKEHRAVREEAGIFDTSHMGEIIISGKDSLGLVQRLATNDASKLEEGMSQYSIMCHKDGGIVDDLYVNRTGEEEYMLCVNASNTGKDLCHIRKVGRKFPGVEIEDASRRIAMIALQGPKAAGMLKKIYSESYIPQRKNSFTKLDLDLECNLVISRTGYTGEDGFELFFDHDKYARAAWEMLLKEGAVPCGLGARDTLRLEMGYPLYGHELSRKTTPLEAGLEWAVCLEKGFLGKESLLRQKKEGVSKKLVGFELLKRGVARQHHRIKRIEKENYKVLLAGDYEVTSGTKSPTLGKSVGMAYVPARYSEEGTELMIEIRDKLVRAKIVGRQFLQK